MGIPQEYRRIMTEEYKLRAYSQPAHLILNSGYIAPQEEIHWEAEQIMEDTRLSTVPRYIGQSLSLWDSHFVRLEGRGGPRDGVLESVGAHTNLLRTLVTRALDFMYGPDFGDPESEYPRTVDGYTFRQIMEVCRLHDLPENDIGDIPDNGAFDGAKKSDMEVEYYRERIYHKYPPRDKEFREQVFTLLNSMHDPDSATGRLIYVADKASAVLMALVYDQMGRPAMQRPSDGLAERTREEMQACDYEKDGYYRISEMWTVDFFRVRKIVNLDDNGFFTALLVMCTLIVHGRWYDWREADYQAILTCP